MPNLPLEPIDSARDTLGAPQRASDPILSRLANQTGTLGALIRAFLDNRSQEPSLEWLDIFFRGLVQETFGRSPSVEADGGDLNGLADQVLEEVRAELPRATVAGLRLMWLRPNYFRGFLAVDAPIDLSAQLVVVYGRNSAGKTSLAEALEWLLTGTLARRAMGQLGNARELERCIGNHFRPQGESTWVEAEFRTASGVIRLRRNLIEDFGVTQTSRCRSVLLKDGQELSEEQATVTLNALFAGVPPLLMQHTLRTFVHSSPSERRNYFERLLRLDELTYLIEKAVIGDTRLPEFASPTGSIALRKWMNARALSTNVLLRGGSSAMRALQR